MPALLRKTPKDILAKMKSGQKIIMLTAYDYPLGQLLDECDVDIILVGDSLANVVLGLESTQEVGMTEMIHHAKAVNRAVKKALLVGDMPYGSYQGAVKDAVKNARRFVTEAGCNGVKLEWFDGCLKVAGAIIKEGIPVMGHVGLTPQTAQEIGGFKVQGKDAQAAQKIIANAAALEKIGCFSVVLECIPAPIAGLISERLKIPTIGIGAGADCDGQVLVTYDLLGLFDRFQPKFVKRYVNLKQIFQEGIKQFKEEVSGGKFPDLAHSYPMSEEEFKRLKDILK